MHKQPISYSQNVKIYFKPLVSGGFFHGGNVMNMHPFIFQVRMRDVQQGQKWAYGLLSMLNSLARIMGYLVNCVLSCPFSQSHFSQVEGTTTMCYNALVELASGADNDVGTKKSKAASKAKKLGDEPVFHSLMQELKAQKARGFSMHPKMELLKGIIVQYFGEKLPDDTADELPEKSKVMVFATNRDSVDEIVSVLNAERPLIRASRFIGQGTDKQGRKGFSQREQLEVCLNCRQSNQTGVHLLRSSKDSKTTSSTSLLPLPLEKKVWTLVK